MAVLYPNPCYNIYSALALMLMTLYGLIFNCFHVRGNFCHQLITFANCFDPDQDRQNVGPDLDPNSLTLIVVLKEIFEKLNLKKKVSR